MGRRIGNPGMISRRLIVAANDTVLDKTGVETGLTTSRPFDLLGKDMCRHTPPHCPQRLNLVLRPFVSISHIRTHRDTETPNLASSRRLTSTGCSVHDNDMEWPHAMMATSPRVLELNRGTGDKAVSHRTSRGTVLIPDDPAKLS